MPNTRISLLEINYTYDKIEARGRLFMNDDGKFVFEGDAEESAKVFFGYLKLACNDYIKKWHKEHYPLFYWRENT